MLKTFVLLNIVFYLSSLSVMAYQSNYKPRQVEKDEKESSSTRGCQTYLPKVKIKTELLKQENPEIRFISSEKGYEVRMAIYPIDSTKTEHWQTSVISSTDWLSLNPSIHIEKGKRYAFALVLPCNGSNNSGERIYEIFELN